MGQDISLRWTRIRGEDGIDEWVDDTDAYRIYRAGGTDRRGHYTYNLGAYVVSYYDDYVDDRDTLRGAKDIAEGHHYMQIT